jgi:hypothetical protein
MTDQLPATGQPRMPTHGLRRDVAPSGGVVPRPPGPAAAHRPAAASVAQAQCRRRLPGRCSRARGDRVRRWAGLDGLVPICKEQAGLPVLARSGR